MAHNISAYKEPTVDMLSKVRTVLISYWTACSDEQINHSLNLICDRVRLTAAKMALETTSATGHKLFISLAICHLDDYLITTLGNLMEQLSDHL